MKPSERLREIEVDLAKKSGYDEGTAYVFRSAALAILLDELDERIRRLEVGHDKTEPVKTEPNR